MSMNRQHVPTIQFSKYFQFPRFYRMVSWTSNSTFVSTKKCLSVKTLEIRTPFLYLCQLYKVPTQSLDLFYETVPAVLGKQLFWVVHDLFFCPVLFLFQIFIPFIICNMDLQCITWNVSVLTSDCLVCMKRNYFVIIKLGDSCFFAPGANISLSVTLFLRICNMGLGI